MISLVVHGGAWDIPDELVDAHREGVRRAVKEAWGILKGGGSAVDAVERAITIMDDDETFDAGRGSFMNKSGLVELDASIMNGKNYRAGAVAAVENVKNPISLARKIMEQSEHVMLVGMGATRFALEHGVKTCKPDDLITIRELDRWRDAHRQAQYSPKDIFSRKRVAADTVGAVALDQHGDIASGTSTGGTPNKHPGRVSDSPLIGCGTYADNDIGGVSTTGWGEALIKVVMAKTVIDLMDRNGGNPGTAVLDGVKILERKVEGFGGIIALNKAGKVGVAFNTPRMARGFMNSGMRTPVVAI
jgi:beta-aspartyl-peptidase (threonine type)